MTKNSNPNSKSVVIAVAVAGFLMFISSAAYRFLSDFLEVPVNTTSLSPAALERLPLQFESWKGKDVPLDEEIVRATDTEAHINRVYSRHNSSEYISLYIAYGVRARDLAPHRPEVCYKGAGWTRIDRRSMDLPLNDGMELPCTALQFSRGTLNTKKIVLLNYYVVDEQYCRDVEGFRYKALGGFGTIRYVAQVQIVASTTVNLNADSATRLVCDFAAESASSISRLFESDEGAIKKSSTHVKNPFGL
jgi:EpsI family protein